MIAPVRDLIVGRLGLPTVDANISELLGSEVTATGDSTAVGQRRVKMFTLVFPIHGTPGDANPQLTGNRMRRQIRSFSQNSQYRLSGVYVKFLWDPERNGFMVIGTASLADADGGPIFGDYVFTVDNAFRVAALNTHRDGYRVALTDMRLTSSPIDYLGTVVNTGALFAGLTPLQILALPVGATDATVLDTSTTGGVRVSADGSIPVITGRAAYGAGGSAAPLVTGDVVSWERPEASFNLGDVVVYDRRGFVGANGVSGAFDVVPFPTDVQTSYGWEEIYGPDFPYNWLVAGQPMDAPVISNGLCRVRYDASGTTYAGFIVDAWNPATSAYVEQGKIGVRNNTNTNPDTVVLSAGVVEYTPDRAVIQAVLSVAAGANRERVYITLQRGWTGPRVEVYSNGMTATTLIFQVPSGEVNTGVMENPGVLTTGGAAYASSASGSSTSPFVSGTTLSAGFTGENFVAVVRQGKTHQLNVAVLTSPLVALTQAYTLYAAAGNAVTLQGNGSAGNPVDYVSAHLGFSAMQTGQVAESEAIRNASGTTAQVTDATAASGFAVSDTQTAATAVTLTEATTFQAGAMYRLFARVKVGTSGATGSWKWAVGAGASGVVTSTATAWTWVDLGGVVAAVVNPTLTVTGWRSAGAGNVQIDRVEAVLTQDLTFNGSRDLGRAALLSQLAQPRKVSRA